MIFTTIWIYRHKTWTRFKHSVIKKKCSWTEKSHFSWSEMIKSGENVVFNNPPDIYQCRFILIVTDLSSQNQKWHSELGLFPLFFFWHFGFNWGSTDTLTERMKPKKVEMVQSPSGLTRVFLQKPLNGNTGNPWLTWILKYLGPTLV